jgi:hypothetical protein
MSASSNHFGIIDVPDDDWQVVEPSPHRRLIPTLAGDDSKPVGSRANHERLQNPLFRNRRDELEEVAHGLAWLMGIGIDCANDAAT